MSNKQETMNLKNNFSMLNYADEVRKFSLYLFILDFTVI